MSRRKIIRSGSTFKAVVYAVLVHVAVIVILVVSFHWASDSDTSDAKIIKAVAVQDTQAQKKKDEERLKRKREAEKKKIAAEDAKRRQAQQLKRKKEEHKRKTAEAEKKRQAEIQRNKKLEEERKRKQADEERQRKQAEQALAQQLKAEEEARERAAREARAMAVADQYIALIRQKVRRNWARPLGSEKGLQSTVMVKLAPGGEVIEATVVRPSGDTVFDRSVERAVYIASPLPLPEEADLFEYFRKIEFIFKPEK